VQTAVVAAETTPTAAPQPAVDTTATKDQANVDATKILAKEPPKPEPAPTPADKQPATTLAKVDQDQDQDKDSPDDKPQDGLSGKEKATTFAATMSKHPMKAQVQNEARDSGRR